MAELIEDHLRDGKRLDSVRQLAASAILCFVLEHDVEVFFGEGGFTVSRDLGQRMITAKRVNDPSGYPFNCSEALAIAGDYRLPRKIILVELTEIECANYLALEATNQWMVGTAADILCGRETAEEGERNCCQGCLSWRYF